MKITNKTSNEIEITLENGCVVKVNESTSCDRNLATVEVSDPCYLKETRERQTEVDAIHIETSDSGITTSFIHMDSDASVNSQTIQKEANGYKSLKWTNIKLNKSKIYKGIKATNIPNYKKEGLIFVNEILLNKSEYIIISK